jgi:hypothetical protein
MAEETAKLAARERLKIIALAFLVGVWCGCGRWNRMDGSILPSILGLVLVIPHFCAESTVAQKGYRIYGFFAQSPWIFCAKPTSVEQFAIPLFLIWYGF